MLATLRRPATVLSRVARTMSSNEQSSAEAAAAQMFSPPDDTIFGKIARKEIPADIVFEDNDVMAFRDVNPQAPTHIVLIPKERDGLAGLRNAEERHTSILGKMLVTAGKVAAAEGLEDGYRIVINDGPQGCQSVYHLHIHILGGRQLRWPPG